MSNQQAELFFNSKEANGWMQGKTKMKCWKAGLRYWKGSSYSNCKTPQSKPIHKQTSTYHEQDGFVDSVNERFGLK
jgi:hypothetical protein